MRSFKSHASVGKVILLLVEHKLKKSANIEEKIGCVYSGVLYPSVMLNPQQKKAVDIVDGPLLILAGAGSGKTHTLTERICVMIKDHGIVASSILAVTFTNKAAKEMRERIGQKLGVEMSENTNLYR